MKKGNLIWWIIGAIAILGAGAGAYFMLRRKPDEPEAPPPPPVETRTFSANAEDAIADRDLYTTSTNTDKKPRVSLYDPVALDNIGRESKKIEENKSLNGLIRTKNTIGSGLFDGIPTEAAEVIKRSFTNIMDGNYDASSLLRYPIEGKYVNPEMRADIAKIVAQFPNGVKLSPASIKMQSSNALATFGYMASLRYNIVTGTRVPLTLTSASPSQPLTIKPEEIAYHISANQLRSADEIGLNTIKFAQNWLRETDRFNAAVREAAITKLENEGWVFDERTPA
jgi:hypothetical protein